MISALALVGLLGGPVPQPSLEEVAKAYLAPQCQEKIALKEGNAACGPLTVEAGAVGAFSKAGQEEAFLVVRDDNACHAEGLGFTVLVRHEGAVWREVQRLEGFGPGLSVTALGKVKQADGREHFLFWSHDMHTGEEVEALVDLSVGTEAKADVVFATTNNEGSLATDVVDETSELEMKDLDGDGVPELQVDITRRKGSRDVGPEGPLDTFTWQPRQTERVVYRLKDGAFKRSP